MKKPDFKSSVMKSVESQAQQVIPNRPSLAEMAQKIENHERPVKREASPTTKPKPKPERKQLPVKDAFSCTKEDLAKLEKLLERSRRLGIRANKSEVIRAGIWFLMESTDADFKNMLMQIPQIKTGRPSTKVGSND